MFLAKDPYKKLKRAISSSKLKKHKMGDRRLPDGVHYIYSNDNIPFYVEEREYGVIKLQVKVSYGVGRTFATFMQNGAYQVDNVNLVNEMFQACNIKFNVMEFANQR